MSERLSNPNIFILHNRWDASAGDDQQVTKFFCHLYHYLLSLLRIKSRISTRSEPLHSCPQSLECVARRRPWTESFSSQPRKLFRSDSRRPRVSLPTSILKTTLIGWMNIDSSFHWIIHLTDIWSINSLRRSWSIVWAPQQSEQSLRVTPAEARI